MKPAKHIYRVGDLVTVINPFVVLRVGYPMFMGDAIDHVEQSFSKEIHAFIRATRFEPLEVFGESDYRLYRETVKALAGAYMRSKGFGGRERSIHAELREDCRLSGWEVRSKRTVKTGTYKPASMSGYPDNDEYDPPYLDDEHTHVLLLLSPPIRSTVWESIEIDEVNVQPCERLEGKGTI